jgi:hypothetical protein
MHGGRPAAAKLGRSGDELLPIDFMGQLLDDPRPPGFEAEARRGGDGDTCVPNLAREKSTARSLPAIRLTQTVRSRTEISALVTAIPGALTREDG